MRKILTFIILTLAGLVAFGQSLTPCGDCDTIPGRYGKYYYTDWYDSCENFLNPIQGAKTHYFGLLAWSGQDKKRYHTDSTLQILGLTALVDIYAGGAHFSDTTKMPEYLYLLQGDDSKCLVMLDSVRWDTAQPHYMRIPTNYMDTSASYCYAYEAYFPAPITVHDDFYVYGTFNSNTYHLIYDHIPTFYSAIWNQYVRDWDQDDTVWSAPCGPSPGSSRYDFYPGVKDTCIQKDMLYFGHNLPIVPWQRLDLQSDVPTMGGTVGAGIYNKNTTVTFRAEANVGYRFSHWDDGNAENPRSVRLTQDTSFTAYFIELGSFSVYANAMDPMMGQVVGGGTYYDGDEALLEAVPSVGYRFSHWNDGVVANPRTVTVTQDTLFTAIFEEAPLCSLSLASNNPAWGGAMTEGAYALWSLVTIEAYTIDSLARFEEWDDGVTDNPREVTMTGDTMFTAIFSRQDPSLSPIHMAQLPAPVALWPNPAHDRLTVAAGEEGVYLVELYDQRGVLLRRDSFAGKEGCLKIDMLPKGHYILKVVPLHSKQSVALHFVKD